MGEPEKINVLIDGAKALYDVLQKGNRERIMREGDRFRKELEAYPERVKKAIESEINGMEECLRRALIDGILSMLPRIQDECVKQLLAKIGVPDFNRKLQVALEKIPHGKVKL